MIEGVLIRVYMVGGLIRRGSTSRLSHLALRIQESGVACIGFGRWDGGLMV